MEYAVGPRFSPDVSEEGADINGDGVVSEDEFMELMDGDMDLSGDPQQEVSRELLRLKKK